MIATEPSSLTLADPIADVGWSLTGRTVTVTVAGAEVRDPSLAVYVNEPVPLKFGFGVNVTIALSALGEPATHGLLVIAPSVPFVAPAVAKVSWQVPVSEAVSVTGTPPTASSSTTAVLSAATGAALEATKLTSVFWVPLV